MKFNFPMAFSTTLLCWSLLEFPEAYNKSGQLDYMYDSIRWPLEYFVKCHTADNELYVQVKNKKKKRKKREKKTTTKKQTNNNNKRKRKKEKKNYVRVR